MRYLICTVVVAGLATQELGLAVRSPGVIDVAPTVVFSEDVETPDPQSSWQAVSAIDGNGPLVEAPCAS